MSIVLGDVSAYIGVIREDYIQQDTVGLYGLGERSAREQRLLY